MNTPKRILLPLFAATLLMTGVAHAAPDEKAPAKSATDEPRAEQAAHEATGIELSPYELARLIRARLASYATAPKATTRESAVRSAWRVSIKSRIGRMMMRMKRISDSKRWNLRGGSIETWAPKTEATARLLRDLAALYAELSEAEKQMAKARIVEQKVTYFGHVPGKKGREPTREVEGDVSGFERSEGMDLFGLSGFGIIGGKYSIKAKVSNERVRIKVYDREAEQRMKDARQSKIDALVAEIRGRIDRYHNAITQDLDMVRALAASFQLTEEMRLAREIDRLGDAEDRLAAQDLLAEMKIGRLEARGMVFTKASDFGRTLRKDWLQKRAKLLRLLDA